MNYLPLKHIPEPPILYPYQIAAWHKEHTDRGEYYIPQLGGPVVHIDEARDRELRRYNQSQNELIPRNNLLLGLG